MEKTPWLTFNDCSMCAGCKHRRKFGFHYHVETLAHLLCAQLSVYRRRRFGWSVRPQEALPPGHRIRPRTLTPHLGPHWGRPWTALWAAKTRKIFRILGDLHVRDPSHGDPILSAQHTSRFCPTTRGESRPPRQRSRMITRDLTKAQEKHGNSWETQHTREEDIQDQGMMKSFGFKYRPFQSQLLG